MKKFILKESRNQFFSKSLNEDNSIYKSQMIEIFKKAIKDELSASISYKAMAEKVIGAGNSKFKEELLDHGKEEFEHFQELIEYAATHGILSELPLVLDEEVIKNAPSETQAIITFTQNLEKEAIFDYTKASKLARDNDDIETFSFFKELTKDEQSHFDDIVIYTGETRQFGDVA